MNATELRIAAHLRNHGYGSTTIREIAERLDAAGITPELSQAFVSGILQMEQDRDTEAGIRYWECLGRYCEHYQLENFLQAHNHLFGRV